MSDLKYPRREFIQAAGAAFIAMHDKASIPSFGQDESRGYERWLEGLDGRHRAFFDVDALRDGILGRVDNFLGVYRDEYSLRDSDVNVLFGAHGNGLGFVLNDAMWKKYQLGRRYSVMDPRAAIPAVRNIYIATDPSYGWPTDYSITALQKRGVRFLGCRGTMRNLSRQLVADSRRDSADQILSELRSNLIDGAQEVPAMIVAQNRAQEAGLTYAYLV
jgi:intracellular sulfur oxidation DsrE/DsrF family protein